MPCGMALATSSSSSPPPPPGGWGMGCATHPWERVAQGSLPGYNMDAQVCSVFVVALGGGGTVGEYNVRKPPAIRQD